MELILVLALMALCLPYVFFAAPILLYLVPPVVIWLVFSHLAHDAHDWYDDHHHPLGH